MKIRMFLAALALTASQLAAADFGIVTRVEAVELSPSNIILPASTNGMMTFRPCADDCDAEYDRARLTASTVFEVGGRRVKFEDFQIQLAKIKRADDAYALVSVDLITKTVTRINIKG